MFWIERCQVTHGVCSGFKGRRLGAGLICAVPRCGTHMDGLAWHVMIWYGLAKNGLFQFYTKCGTKYFS